MLWRHRCLVRAWSAAGLLSGLMFIGGSIATAQIADPADAPVVPVAVAAAEPSSAPVEVATETVDILKASKTGDLGVAARGQGQDRVRLTIRNRSTRRLNVIVPPGLVAASSVAQGGRGLQSMGLGAVTNREGAFGEFRVRGGPVGLQSIAANDESRARHVTVPVGETIDLSIPAVCLNFGLPSPTPRDTFTLKDVDDYSSDPRVRKALRSLANLGTSHGVAQAAMWRVCNDLPFETHGDPGRQSHESSGNRTRGSVCGSPRRLEFLRSGRCGGAFPVMHVRSDQGRRETGLRGRRGWVANSMD